jgi:hypothetical protein
VLYILLQINNPDKRVVIIKEFALTNFPSNDVLNFALNVEKVTTAKVKFINYYVMVVPRLLSISATTTELLLHNQSINQSTSLGDVYIIEYDDVTDY